VTYGQNVPATQMAWLWPVSAGQQVLVGAGHAVQGHVVHPMAGVYAWQTPLMHSWPAVHAVPHAPQLSGSAVRVTQPYPEPVLHRVFPTGQARLAMHVPALHS